jgi:hypothetical protein
VALCQVLEAELLTPQILSVLLLQKVGDKKSLQKYPEMKTADQTYPQLQVNIAEALNQGKQHSKLTERKHGSLQYLCAIISSNCDSNVAIAITNYCTGLGLAAKKSRSSQASPSSCATLHSDRLSNNIPIFKTYVERNSRGCCWNICFNLLLSICRLDPGAPQLGRRSHH